MQTQIRAACYTIMPDIQLNKTLYSQKPATGSTAPVERPAKPLLWARIGALVLDIMVLHAVMVGIIKIAPQTTVRLGYAGPWVGFVAGILYFGLGYSGLLKGRTLGKLVLRMQVLGVDGPDLPVGKALMRALLTYWPLAILAVLRVVAEKNTPRFELSLAPMIPVIGLGLAGGWLIGNFAHALADPFGRTFIDRLSGSTVISIEASPAVLQEHLRDMREYSDPVRTRYTNIYLWSILTAVTVLAAFNLYVMGRNLKSMPSDKKALMAEYLKIHHVPGFGQPLPPTLVAQGQPARTRLSSSPKVEDTTTAIFLYTRRSPVDLEEVKADPVATSAIDGIVSFTQTQFAKALAEGGQPIMPADRLKFRTSFAEYSDLMFAWGSNPVYEVEKIVEFAKPAAPPVTRVVEPSTTATVQAAQKTSATAATDPSTSASTP